MGFHDLRDFIEQADAAGELQRISGANCASEIGALTELVAAKPECRMLLFDQIKGCAPGARVLSNVLHNDARQSLALTGSPDFRGQELVRELRDILDSPGGGLPPEEVTAGPVLENVIRGDDVNLYDLPAVQWHERDGGPYFTGGVCVTRDPDGGWINLGVYRTQIQDKNTLSLHIEPGKHGHLITRRYWALGQNCPIAISLGHIPGLFVAASGIAPWGQSEYDIAGRLNDAPIQTLPGVTTGLPVPAYSEVVLEGEVPPWDVENAIEGPWGEAVGYYASQPELKPVIKVKSVMHRTDPIIQGAPPMKPLKGMKHFAVSFRLASLWRDLERCSIPEIKGVWEYAYGIIVVVIDQRYSGHAKQAALIAAGSRSSGSSRFIIIVDADIDPCDWGQVAWALSSRCDPARDIDIIQEGWSGANDPIVTGKQLASIDYTTGKVLINACTPRWREDAFPPVVEVSLELKAEVLKNWSHVLG